MIKMEILLNKYNDTYFYFINNRIDFYNAN